MKQLSIGILKTVCADARKTIFGVILLALLGGTGGVLYLSRTALNYAIQTANILTPLWATIALVLLCCGYTYIKVEKTFARLAQQNHSQNASINADEIKTRNENRKNKIKEWRDVFSKAESVEDIMYTPAFIYFKKRLESKNINIGDFINRRVFILGAGNGEKHKLMKLLELVDEIEKEWGLL